MTSTVDDARKLLGLDGEFSDADLKTAFRHAAFTTHPDTGGTHESFIAILNAMTLLRKHVTHNAA